MSGNPVLVEITRGSQVESQHRGAFAVVNAGGEVVYKAGDIQKYIFPRSSAKPLQALALIETGAADAFQLTNREIALACASHRGEPEHVAAIQEWLSKIALNVRDLECGTHPPVSSSVATDLARKGIQPTSAHHNCSGKHTGFLTTCVALGDCYKGYVTPQHPAQRRVTAILSEMTGEDLAAAKPACDGCGIPVYAMPLKSLALGMARLADPIALPHARRHSIERIRQAMQQEPFYVEGTGSFVTETMKIAPNILVKGGFEGVYTAALPHLGFGVAVKVDDGAMRAAQYIMAFILMRLNCFDATQSNHLGQFLEPRLLTNAGHPAGIIRASPQLTPIF